MPSIICDGFFKGTIVNGAIPHIGLIKRKYTLLANRTPRPLSPHSRIENVKLTYLLSFSPSTPQSRIVNRESDQSVALDCLIF